MIKIMLQPIQVSSPPLKSAVQVAEMMIVPRHLHHRRYHITQILLSSCKLLLEDGLELIVLSIYHHLLQPLLFKAFDPQGHLGESVADLVSFEDVSFGD